MFRRLISKAITAQADNDYERRLEHQKTSPKSRKKQKDNRTSQVNITAYRKPKFVTETAVLLH